MGIQWWPSVLLGLAFGYLFWPWLWTKVSGKTGASAGAY